MKMIISAWQRDQSYFVEHCNIIVRRTRDCDEYLLTIPAGCTDDQKKQVIAAYLKRLATRYPDGFFSWLVEDYRQESGATDGITRSGHIWNRGETHNCGEPDCLANKPQEIEDARIN